MHVMHHMISKAKNIFDARLGRPLEGTDSEAEHTE